MAETPIKVKKLKKACEKALNKADKHEGILQIVEAKRLKKIKRLYNLSRMSEDLARIDKEQTIIINDEEFDLISNVFDFKDEQPPVSWDDGK